MTGAIPSDTGENERRRPNWLVMRAGNSRRAGRGLGFACRSNLFPRLQSTHCCHRVRFCQSLLWTNPARLLPVSCFISVEATAYLAYQTPSRISFGWVVRLWSISATVHHYSRLPHMPCRVQPSLFRLFKFAPCYNTWFWPTAIGKALEPFAQLSNAKRQAHNIYI